MMISAANGARTRVQPQGDASWYIVAVWQQEDEDLFPVAVYVDASNHLQRAHVGSALFKSEQVG